LPATKTACKGCGSSAQTPRPRAIPKGCLPLLDGEPVRSADERRLSLGRNPDRQLWSPCSACLQTSNGYVRKGRGPGAWQLPRGPVLLPLIRASAMVDGSGLRLWAPGPSPMPAAPARQGRTRPRVSCCSACGSTVSLPFAAQRPGRSTSYDHLVSPVSRYCEAPWCCVMLQGPSTRPCAG